MKNRNQTDRQPPQIDEINARAVADPDGLIAEEETRYRRAVNRAAERLILGDEGRRLVMLSGPSASGKTTTAHLLRDDFISHGLEATVVSLDDFYRGRGLAPVLEDGSLDYEALEALDLPRLYGCMRDLMVKGEALMPIYDFTLGRPLDEPRLLRVNEESVVIFEGIHALNPVFDRHLPDTRLQKVFVSTASSVYRGEEKVLQRRQIRLTRRILRDLKFRGSSLENTLQMWDQVKRGEDAYMFPFAEYADEYIDTLHAYEPGMFAGEILPVLEAIDPADPHLETVRALHAALSQFVPLSLDRLPQNSLLREFVG
ncbi:MAG: uridine kinase family protein [Acutalibacteraceae bacterium]|jgi:uridine kinase